MLGTHNQASYFFESTIEFESRFLIIDHVLHSSSISKHDYIHTVHIHFDKNESDHEINDTPPSYFTHVYVGRTILLAVSVHETDWKLHV